jgi:hypothetical protein
MQFITLPNGEQVATGLMMPRPVNYGVTKFPLYDDHQPMLTAAQIEEIARGGKMRGRQRFGRKWIGNQRNKGSCNGWAIARALSRALKRAGVNDIESRLLSGAYAYSLMNGGRDNGSMLEDAMEISQTRGIATEATVPWDKIYPSLYDRAKADAEAAMNKAFEAYAVRTKDALFSAAALGFDLVVAVHADNGFMRLDGEKVAGGGYGPGNHSVAGDGLFWAESRREPALDGYNSWGVEYGDEGYMGLTWNQHFRHTTQYHVFFAIRGVVSKNDDMPPPAV